MPSFFKNLKREAKKIERKIRPALKKIEAGGKHFEQAIRPAVKASVNALSNIAKQAEQKAIKPLKGDEPSLAIQAEWPYQNQLPTGDLWSLQETDLASPSSSSSAGMTEGVFGQVGSRSREISISRPRLSIILEQEYVLVEAPGGPHGRFVVRGAGTPSRTVVGSPHVVTVRSPYVFALSSPSSSVPPLELALNSALEVQAASTPVFEAVHSLVAQVSASDFMLEQYQQKCEVLSKELSKMREDKTKMETMTQLMLQEARAAELKAQKAAHEAQEALEVMKYQAESSKAKAGK